jgi:stage II sporulation protein AA (anti-sigma F factor antagonist)
MNLACSERNRNLIVKITGEIDHHTAEGIKERVEKELLRSGAKNIIFDFAGVEVMDSSGIGMIIGRYKRMEALGGKVFAINIGAGVARIFEISGLKKIIGCYASVEDAERA